MTFRIAISSFLLAMAVFAQPAGRGARGGAMFAPVDETGFKPMFDGASLKGWDCDPDFWRVENGVIVGETRADHQPKQNIFCIWRDGKPDGSSPSNWISVFGGSVWQRDD